MPNNDKHLRIVGGPDFGANITENERQTRHEEPMSTPTREEFEARLETIEAKMDSRVASIEGKIDALLATLQGNENLVTQRWKTQDARFMGFEERDKRLELLAQQANDSAARATDAAEKAAGLRASYWASVAAQVAAVAAIIVGAYFANQASVIGIGQLVASSQNQPPPTTPPKK